MGRKSERLAILKYYFNNFRTEWHQDALSSEIDESFPTDFIISRKILRRNKFRTLNRKNYNIYAQAREECEEKLAEMIAKVKAQIKAKKEKITGWPKSHPVKIWGAVDKEKPEFV